MAAAAGAMLLIAVGAAGCGGSQDKLRGQLLPVVAKISDRIKGTAALTGGGAAQAIEQTGAYLTDLAGLGADLKALYVEGERQQSLVAAAQAYLSATQRFVAAQQEFARALARLEAARAKVKDSLDAKARTSKFSLDFWKETHDRLVLDLDKVRKDSEQARDRLAAATTSTQQAADAAAAVLGREAIVAPEVLAAHRKALDAIPLAKGA